MDEDVPLNRLATGFGKRTLATARLASRLGLSYARRVKRGRAAEGATDPRQAVRQAEALLEQLGSLKGLLMKFGQMASYMPGSLPPAAQEILARLQHQSTPMAFEQVDGVVADELGASAKQLFEVFDERPFAAASIGQVHRARLDDRELAVKVQYPGIERALRSDLRAVGLLAKLMTAGSATSGRIVAQDLRERIVQECDYLAEARHQRLFTRLWADSDGHVPAVVDERSTRRVLTTELARGEDLAAFCKHDQTSKDRAAQTIFKTCFRSIFEHAVYNADPHPGNYLFQPDGSVTFLDFGCVCFFEAAMIEGWKQMARAVLAGDPAGFRRYAIELGFVDKDIRYDWDYQWRVMQYLYRPLTQREPFTYTDDYVAQSYDLLIFNSPNVRQTSMPAGWLFVNRLQWGLNAILARLTATGPWRQIWRDALDAPLKPAAGSE